MRELLSFRGYAKRRGVSPEAVSKAVETGRISTVNDVQGRRKIDPEVADIQWKAKTDALQAQRAAGLQTRAQPAEIDDSPDGDIPDVPGLSDERRRVESARASMFELDLAEKLGEMVRADEVRRAAFEKARAARDALMGLADRLAPLVAPESDRAKCHDLIATEARRICTQLAAGDFGTLN